MPSFLDAVRSNILVGDGAVGTELQKLCLPLGTCFEHLNLTRPDIVQELYRSYYNAGSDFVETNTFGANRSTLEQYGLGHKVLEINCRAVELAKNVCPANCFVGGCIGPLNDNIDPFGPISENDAFDYFTEQAEALAEGGADFIILDTMSDGGVIEIAMLTVKEATRLPLIANMTFEAKPIGLRTAWGIDVACMVQLLTNSGADVIGANCSAGLDVMLRIMTEMRPLTKLPIIAQPNAGIPELVNDQPVYKQTPGAVRAYAEQICDLGVNILGGCCGTDPWFIKILREIVDSRQKNKPTGG